MKKSFLALLSVLFVFSFILAGCGSDEPKSVLEGTTWSVTGGKDGTGIEITSELLDTVGVGDFTLEFKEGSVLTASLAGETTDGTWSEKENVVTMELDGESVTANLEEDQIALEQDDLTLYFGKQ